jgi:hypothetical protein
MSASASLAGSGGPGATASSPAAAPASAASVTEGTHGSVSRRCLYQFPKYQDLYTVLANKIRALSFFKEKDSFFIEKLAKQFSGKKVIVDSKAISTRGALGEAFLQIKIILFSCAKEL